MVKLHPISTPNKNMNLSSDNNSNSSSSTSSNQSSPTTPLPPPPPPPPKQQKQAEVTMLPPVMLFPHHHYPPHQPYPLIHPQQPLVVLSNNNNLTRCYYYSTPYYPQQQQQQGQKPVNVYAKAGCELGDAMDPTVRGPRYSRYGYGNGVRGKRVTLSRPWDGKRGKSVYGNGNGNGNGNGSEVEVKKVWKVKGKESNEGKERNEVTENPKTIRIPAELANCTTIMLKNIPNGLRRNNLIKMLDIHCRKHNGKYSYDFVYLPFDFVHEQNLGYAFINYTSVEGASSLYTDWNNKGWTISPKIRAVTPAKLQGLSHCRRHFKNSVFNCNSWEYLPLEFFPPRNGFNDGACEASTIGNWIKGNFLSKYSSNKGRRSKSIPPPRFNLSLARR